MLSIGINVKNGAKHLELCLNALQRFDEVVLLDNYSTDNTLEIANKYPNVKIFQHEFLGMGSLRNMTASFSKNDWMFFVDCDEIVSQSLVNTLLNFNFVAGYVYSILRLNYYDNKQVSTSSWENDWVNRIYNRRETKYLDYAVHESVDTTGLVVQKIASGSIYHFPYGNASALLEKTQFYSTLYAKQNLARKKVNLFTLPFRTFLTFIKCYFLKSGFRDGYEGFVVSSFNAIGVFVKYIKLYELKYRKSIALAINPKTLDIKIVESLINKINAQVLLPKLVVVILENEINNTFETEIKVLLKNNLVVPSIIIRKHDEKEIYFLESDIITQCLERQKIDYLVYVENHSFLEKKNFLKRCRKQILNGKPIAEARLIDRFNLKIGRD